MILLSIYIASAVITMFIASAVIFVYTKDFAEGLQYIGAAISAGVFCFVTIPFVIIVGGAWLISNKIKSNMRKMGIKIEHKTNN